MKLDQHGISYFNQSKLVKNWALGWVILGALVIILLAGHVGLQIIKGQGWATYPIPASKEAGSKTWVTDAVVDERGFPWVGTNRGLYRLNPSGNWQSIIYNFVVDLDIDSQRRIWVATEQQIYVIDQDGKKTSYPGAYSSNGLNLSTSTGFERYLAMTSDNLGRVWIWVRKNTDQGYKIEFGRLDPDGRWNPIFSDIGAVLPTLDKLITDQENRVWMAWNGGLTMVLPDGQWNVYTPLNSELRTNSVNGLAIDNSNRIWVQTGMVVSMVNLTGPWIHYQGMGLGLYEATLAVDKQGRIWEAPAVNEVGSSGVGILMRGLDGNWITHTKSNSGLAFNAAKVLTVDEQDRVWIATQQVTDQTRRRSLIDAFLYGPGLVEAGPFLCRFDLRTAFPPNLLIIWVAAIKGANITVFLLVFCLAGWTYFQRERLFSPSLDGVAFDYHNTLFFIPRWLLGGASVGLMFFAFAGLLILNVQGYITDLLILPGYLVIKLLLTASSFHLEQGIIDFLSLCITSLLYAFIGALYAMGHARLGKLVLVIIIVLFIAVPVLFLAFMIYAISRGSP